MNVSLTAEQEKYVHAKVASGKYASASEVIREGLRLLQEQEELRQLRLRKLDEEIEKGLQSIRDGKVVDGPEAMERIKQRIEKHIETSRKK